MNTVEKHIVNIKITKIVNKDSTKVSKVLVKLSPNCSPNTAETLVHLNSLQIMKSITQFFSKPVKLIKPILPQFLLNCHQTC